MRAFKKKQLYMLKSAIKGFATETKITRRKYYSSTNQSTRTFGQDRKNCLANMTTAHLFAYALMCGKKHSYLRSTPVKTTIGDRSYYKSMYKQVLTICHLYGDYRVQCAGNKELSEEAFMDWVYKDENNIFVIPEKRAVRTLRCGTLSKKLKEVFKKYGN